MLALVRGGRGLGQMAASYAARARTLSDEPFDRLLAAPSNAEPRRVIVDCDPGVDDAFALALALRSPELAVQAITIVAGNSPDVTQMARNAIFISELCGRHGVPVHMGAREPIERAFRGHIGAFCHGASGLGSVTVPPGLSLAPMDENSDVSGADMLAKTALRHPGALSVISLGPLTNVARACALTRAFRTSLDVLVSMAGAVTVPGNVNPFAEFNAYCDPEALQTTLVRVASPIVLASLDVTTQLPLSERFMSMLAQRSPLGRALADIASHYVSSLGSRGHTAFVHDAVAVMSLVRPDLFRARRALVDVVVSDEGDRAGQTVESPDGVEVILLTSVDAPAFYDEFVRRV